MTSGCSPSSAGRWQGEALGGDSHLRPLVSSLPPLELWPADGVDVRDSIYSRLQCPQRRVGVKVGGGSSVRLCSRTQVGDLRGEEVKIAQPATLRPRPGPALGLGPGAILGPGSVTLPEGRPPPGHPPPPAPPGGQARQWVPAQQAEEGREGHGRAGQAGEGGAGGSGLVLSCPQLGVSLVSAPGASGTSRTQHSSLEAPLPPRAPPAGPPTRRPVCSGRSDPGWLSSGSPGGGVPFSLRRQQPGRPLRRMQ